jgi:hypothetical protein
MTGQSVAKIQMSANEIGLPGQLFLSAGSTVRAAPRSGIFLALRTTRQSIRAYAKDFLKFRLPGKNHTL